MQLRVKEVLERRGLDAEGVRQLIADVATERGFHPDDGGALRWELRRRGWQPYHGDGTLGGYTVELERVADIDDVIVSHVATPGQLEPEAEASALRAALAMLILGEAPQDVDDDGA